MTSDEYLSVLNPEQKAAIIHEKKPLLILAGAGSGKTRVITTKIAYLIAEKGYAPSSILAVTFTKKAANEMAERAEHLEPLAVKTQIRTFHSFGAWFLRTNAEDAGLDPNFTVYDDDDMVTLVSKAVPTLSRQQASSAAHKISLAKDYCLSPDSPELATIDANEEFSMIYSSYQKRLRETGNVDFGDLIMLPVLILQNNPIIKSYMHQRFRVVMVDEYQDSNVAQFSLLQQLVGENTYVCVVGDDDQSIYRFRGAEVKNILTFQEHFPGTDIIKLERNYRSFSPILSIAGNVVSKNKGRLGKTLVAERGDGKKPTLVFLPTQDDESAFCAELIKQSHKKGCPYSDWAILYRTNAQSLGFETEFLHRKIPYTVIGSLKFYEREEIKDTLAFLSLIANPKDEIAFRRVINKPSRGIGNVTQDKIINESRSNLTTNGSLVEAARTFASSASKKAKTGLLEFTALIDDLVALIDNTPESPTTVAEHLAEKAASINEVRDESTPITNDSSVQESNSTAQENSSIATTNIDSSKKNAISAGNNSDKLAFIIEKIVTLSGLADYHTAQDEISGTQRLSNLQELVNSAVLYPLTRTGLLEFLDHIELDRSLVEDSTEGTDAVTLITLHNTKGLEFSRVIITGLESGIFPRTDKTGDELEEERRLFYVGITRARDELYITSCAMRRLYGRTDYMEISPFLLDIDSNSIDILGSKPQSYRRAIRNASIVQTPKSTDNAQTTDKPTFGKQISYGGHELYAEKSEDFLDPEVAELAERWHKGQKLYHDDYGSGVITSGTEVDGEFVITVQFETGTIKRFMPKYQAHRLDRIND